VWGAACGTNPPPEWSGNQKATLLTEYDLRVALGLRYLGARPRAARNAGTGGLAQGFPISIDRSDFACHERKGSLLL